MIIPMTQNIWYIIKVSVYYYAKKLIEGKNMIKEGKKEEIYKKLKLVEKKVAGDKVKHFIEHKVKNDSPKIAIDKLINSAMDKQSN